MGCDNGELEEGSDELDISDDIKVTDSSSSMETDTSISSRTFFKTAMYVALVVFASKVTFQFVREREIRSSEIKKLALFSAAAVIVHLAADYL
jgi:hypothetical protein